MPPGGRSAYPRGGAAPEQPAAGPGGEALSPFALTAAILAAAATPAVFSVHPVQVRPGDAFLVEARGAAPPAGAVAGRPLQFFPVPGGYEALAALPLETAPGTLTVEVTAASAALPQAKLSAPLQVVEPRFPAKTLFVEPRFIEPAPEVRARMDEDQAAIARATAVPFIPPLFRAPFAWPRPPTFTGRYGDQRLYNGKLASQHYGLDFKGAVGDPVRAGNAGVVVLRRDCYASGLTLILHHGAGLFTSYFHLSKALVQEGERVRRGALIGAVGASGRATGPHLHYSVRVGDLYVDPESVMRLGFVARPAAG